MWKIRGYFLFVLFSLFFIKSYSIVQIPFEHLELKSGFTIINDIYRDENDFLWIANEGFGLLRYDTYKTISFTHDENDPTSISNNYLNKIFVDSKNNFWVLTFHSLDLFDRETQTFKHYLDFSNSELEVLERKVNDIAEDKEGRLWIATGNGLYEYLHNEDTVILYNNPGSSELQNNFTGISIDKKGDIWLGSLASAIFHFNRKTREFAQYEMNIPKALTNNIKRLFVDSDNIIWIGMPVYGLASFDPQNKSFRYFEEKRDGTGLYQNFVLDIKEFNKGQIYIATDQGGINIYDKATEKFEYANSKYNNVGDLSSDGINCMEIDKEGILWVGTTRGGINYFNPKKNIFKSLRTSDFTITDKNNKHLSYGVVGAFLEDSKGKIWIGTDGGGINIFDRETGDIEVYTTNNSNLSSDIIRALSEDSNGDIWIATWAGKVNKYIRKKKRFVQINYLTEINKGYADNTVWSVKVDNKDRIWINYSAGHVLVLDKNGNELMSYRATNDGNIRHYYNETLFLDDNNEIFVNTSDGVFRFNEKELRLEQFLPENSIVTFTVDKNRNYWAGTLNNGAYRYNSKGVLLEHYDMDKGISGNCIYSIEYSDNGMIWLATENGLNQVILSDSTILKHFDSDGFQSNQYFLQASLKTKDGQLFFGGIQGVDYFYPNEIKKNTFVPKVYMEKLYVHRMNEEPWQINSLEKIQANNEVIKLKWDDIMLTFEFYAVNYTFPTKTLYKYKLYGFDEVMDYSTTQGHFATFTNLKPGEYKFHVMASNDDGVWNEDSKPVTLLIEAPFWQKKWFYAICIAVAFSIIWLIINWRSQILLREKEILKKSVEERTKTIANQNKMLVEQKEALVKQQDELKTHKEKLEMMVSERTKQLVEAKLKAEKSDRLKSYFLANMSHEIRTPMNAIFGFSTLLDNEELTEKDRREFVHIIQNNANALIYLIEDILDFSMIEADQLKIESSPFYISELLKNIYSSFSVNIDNPEVALLIQNDLEDSDLMINSCEQRIRQILANLISNAIKFTGKGHIKLGACKVDDQLELYVEDTGVGISQGQQEEIFEHFVKLERDQEEAKRGIGLGLAISKKLANLLGGKLRIDSRLNEGSRFTFSLPYTLVKHQAPQIKKENLKKGKENINWSGRKILVVEDELANSQLLEIILKPTKIDIDFANNGQQAVDLYIEGKPYDAVLMDIKMPNMDGFKALQLIRDIEPAQVVIAQTAYAKPEDEIKIKKAGFNGYITKPIFPKLLFDILLDNIKS